MHHSHHREDLVLSVTWAAVTVALVLITIKTFALWVSGLLTIQASLLDSVSDFFGSMINFFAVRYSRRPANDSYRFGHGKAEALAGFVQSILIIISTAWVVWHAFQHRQIIHSIDDNSLALWVMGFSTVITLWLVFLQVYTIKHTGSIAVKADYLHYQADIFSNIAAVIALVALTWFGICWVDIVLGIGIVVFLLVGSWNILKQSSSILMDKELEPTIREEILKHIQSHPKVIEAHDLRTRSAGQQDFIQVHITLDPALTLKEAHVIGNEVETTLQHAYPKAEILIHLDPLGYHLPLAE